MRNLDSIFDGAERTAPNPFREDVFASGITPLPGVTEVHGEAMTRCIRAFESLLSDRGGEASAWAGSGRTILIAAPRAGYGKSHLVGRVRAVTESLIAPVSLPFDPARKVAWETVLPSIFNQYRSARCPQHTECSLFEEVARFFQSRVVRKALELGLIDEKEIPETEVAIRLQFREVFDPQAKTRMVSWLTKRSPEIMDAVSLDLGKRWRLEFDDLVFWNRFFQDASRPKTTAFETLRLLKSSEARGRLNQFLRIASDCRPIAFIADHLDGFFGSDTAGMQIAEILTEIRFSVPRSVTLLCLNEDVWESIFEGRIPSAWIDRLTGEAAPLAEMSEEEAEGLLLARLAQAGMGPEDADAWLQRNRPACIEADGGRLYPRELLRRAAGEWDREGASSSRSPFSTPAAPDPLQGIVLKSPLPVEPSTSDREPEEGNVFSPIHPPEMPVTSSVEPERAPIPTPSPVSPLDSSRSRDSGAEDLRDREEHSSAARAAGIDLSSGLGNIDAIIADIRGQGARALSETQSPASDDALKESPRSSDSDSPVPPKNVAGATQPAEVSAPASRASGIPRNPFSSLDLGHRLEVIERELKNESSAVSLEWQPSRLRRVIMAVGGQFPAVAQTEEAVAFRTSLVWNVRGALVRLGFEAPEHFAYWSEVLAQAIGDESPGKVVLFSHPSAPFGHQSLAAMGADPATAMRFLDVVEVGHADLVRIYAAERFIDEAQREGKEQEALRILAQHLDGFWRRIGRPLRKAGAAG